MWKMMRLRDDRDTEKTSNIILEDGFKQLSKAQDYFCATTITNTRKKRHASFTKK